jgi:hypothetical protein
MYIGFLFCQNHASDIEIDAIDGFDIKPDSSQLLNARNSRACPGVAVRNGAQDTIRPYRRTSIILQNRHRAESDSAERLSCTGSARCKFQAAFLDGFFYELLLLRVEVDGIRADAPAGRGDAVGEKRGNVKGVRHGV